MTEEQDITTSLPEGSGPAAKAASPMVVLGLVIGLVALVALSFVLNGSGAPGAGGDGPAVAPVPEARSTAVPSGSDPATLPAAPLIGKLAPDFSWLGAAGAQVRLSDYRGKSVLINFWATWCAPCKAEMPEIEAYWKENRDQPIMVLAVNVGDEDEATIRAFMQKNRLSFQAVNDVYGQVGTSYRVGGIPASFFIDAKGVVRETYVGGMTKGIISAKMAKAK